MDITAELAGMKLKSPLLPASGPLTGTAEKLIELSRFPLGALVTKTISVEKPDIPRQFIQGYGNFIMNCEPWSEYSADVWKKEFLPVVKRKAAQPLFISLGYSADDMKHLVPLMNGFADGYEISTHYTGKDLSPVEETVRTVRGLTDKPVYMKVSPHFPDPVAFAEAVMENGGNGIVAVNSLGPSMKIDLSSRSVAIGNKEGQAWMSGPAIKPVALAFVNNIRRHVPGCEIIGVGGVETAEDVLEFLLAGADAVEMLSAALLKGRGLYQKIIDDLPGVLEKYHFSSVREVVETDLKISSTAYGNGKPVFDAERCVKCGICQNICPFFAIEKTDICMNVNPDKCLGCGLCITRCPKNAVSRT